MANLGDMEMTAGLLANRGSAAGSDIVDSEHKTELTQEQFTNTYKRLFGAQHSTKEVITETVKGFAGGFMSQAVAWTTMYYIAHPDSEGSDLEHGFYSGLVVGVAAGSAFLGALGVSKNNKETDAIKAAREDYGSYSRGELTLDDIIANRLKQEFVSGRFKIKDLMEENPDTLRNAMLAVKDKDTHQPDYMLGYFLMGAAGAVISFAEKGDMSLGVVTNTEAYVVVAAMAAALGIKQLQSFVMQKDRTVSEMEVMKAFQGDAGKQALNAVFGALEASGQSASVDYTDSSWWRSALKCVSKSRPPESVMDADSASALNAELAQMREDSGFSVV